MLNARKKAKDYLDSLSREEFITLLEQAGFEVSDGSGEVIFRDEQKEDVNFAVASVWTSSEKRNASTLADGYPLAS